MQGMMQTPQLLISTLIEHAALNHGDSEVVSRASDRAITRSTYAGTARRAKQVAKALHRLGLRHGDRVGTLAWNTHRHLELYYGVSGSGLINHTINPRLFFDQILFIATHARDRVLVFDLSFIDIIERLAPKCGFVEHWIALCQESEVPTIPGIDKVKSYEALLSQETDGFAWPQFDENTASSLCYTSGSTGDPKGVLYSHRSTVLHSYAGAMRDTFGICANDVVLPASSMYHANAWGVPYIATLAGSKLVLPGQLLDGASLCELIDAEGVTISCGVPTIWLGVLQHLERTGRTLRSLNRIIIGGSSCPPSLITTFRERYRIDVNQLWGMTETSPLGTVNHLKPKHALLAATEKEAMRAKQGRIVYGIEMKIVDDAGNELPRDGIASGNLMVRGWWVAQQYYGQDASAVDAQGWFPTGDVASIDVDGYMRITDRSKDVIKSGGEWISSIDLENAAVGHPSVAEAAVIAIPHPKWDERPLLILKLKNGRELPKDEIIEFLKDKVAKWWLPDDVVVVEEIPHTATGKILKSRLREQFRDYRPPAKKNGHGVAPME